MSAARHWINQRYSAIALLPLSLLFLASFASTLGQPLPQVIAIWSGPAHASVAIAFFAVLFTHVRQGLQEVVTDYVHGPARRPLLLAITAICLILPLVAIAGLVRIAFF
jgi:succinate dehydrogenase / fumarate reductase, membrane anchor subunit